MIRQPESIDGGIDAGLLCLKAWQREHPGVALTQKQIAIVCGCHRSAIQQIEQAALRKIRKYRVKALQEFRDV